MIYLQIFKLRFWKYLIFVSVLYYIYLNSELLLERLYIFSGNDYFLDTNKCPFCYGTSSCKLFLETPIEINFFNFHTLFSILLGTRNTFFGKLGHRDVVLKKLADTNEFLEFDHFICEHSKFHNFCSYKFHDSNIDMERNVSISFTEGDVWEEIRSQLHLNFEEDNLSKLRFCPNENANLLFSTILEKSNNRKGVEKITELLNIWTMLKINPEPLILQIIPSTEGWPVPKYMGSCGRTVIEEYVGTPLVLYYNYPWTIRAKIASSLLKAVHKLTFNHPNFAFYLTDISFDNIAVDGNHNAVFIDLENIIIVDKNGSVNGKSETWNILHESSEENENCPHCFTFSPIDICSHRISDHNVYAVCQQILGAQNLGSSNFLHDIPKPILQKYPKLMALIEQCVHPTNSNNRFEIAQELKSILDVVNNAE